MRIRGQSEDDRVLNEVEDLWDQACDRYQAHLNSIRPDLPPGIRGRLDSYYLHDALIRGMGLQGNSFVIVVQLDTPPQSLITFSYDLLSEPIITKDTLPSTVATQREMVAWQYDEIERVEGIPATWQQLILLSNGWEVQLHFRDVSVQEVQALIPAPGNGQATGVGSRPGPIAALEFPRG